MAKKPPLFDIPDIPWEAIARVVAPVIAPLILAVAWALLARTNKTVDWLSNVFALAELTPAVDLNLPSGVVLGSFYNSAEEIAPVAASVIDFAQDIEKDISKLKEDPLETLWSWFTFDVRKTKEFKEREKKGR